MFICLKIIHIQKKGGRGREKETKKLGKEKKKLWINIWKLGYLCLKVMHLSYRLVFFPNHLITFSYLCNVRESIVFGSKFRNGVFDGFTRYEGPLNPKILFLAFGLCVCYQHHSKTNYSKDIKFGSLHLYHIQMLTINKLVIYV